MNDGAIMAFLEDKEILEDVHAGMKNPSTPNIDLGLDAGAKLFRKFLGGKIEEEQDNL
jgi:vanillate O-demethylase monooxygenase subunit